MTFVNEYVSEEDIQKYQLDEISNKYVQIISNGKYGIDIAERKRVEEKFKEPFYNWTHDKDLNSWLKKEAFPCIRNHQEFGREALPMNFYFIGIKPYIFLFYR